MPSSCAHVTPKSPWPSTRYQALMCPSMTLSGASGVALRPWVPQKQQAFPLEDGLCVCVQGVLPKAHLGPQPQPQQ